MDTFRVSFGEKILDECSKCGEVDIVDCNTPGCPHQFPEKQKQLTRDIFDSINKALERRRK